MTGLADLKHRVVLFTVFAFSAAGVHASPIGRNSCGELMTVICNRYCTTRSFFEYNRVFAGELEPLLDHVAKTGGHWVDMGAGEARAQIEYLQLQKSLRLKATGVAYRVPPYRAKAIRLAMATLEGRFNFVKGWFSEATALLIGPVDIITDVYGILYFTKAEYKLEVLDLYISMLKPGGVIFYKPDAPWMTQAWLEMNPQIEYFEKQERDSHVPFTVWRKRISQFK